MLLLNQEWRFPIWRRLRGVVFYDVGQVYLTIEDVVANIAAAGINVDVNANGSVAGEKLAMARPTRTGCRRGGRLP